MRAGILAVGILLIILGVVIPQLPIFNGYSISDANNICKSPLGQFGMALSKNVSEKCGSVSMLYIGFVVILIAGAGITIYGAIAKTK